jgi:DNA-binding transcriptional regulator YiaG
MAKGAEMTAAQVVEARRALGMKKAEFCRVLGIARTTLDFWEKGTHKPMVVFAKMMQRMVYAKKRVGQA